MVGFADAGDRANDWEPARVQQELPPALGTAANAVVLNYVKDRSAHSDVADALLESIKPLGDAQVFCPNPARYNYVIASTRNIIFAFAMGMNQVGFRLDPDLKARALETGATAWPECGEDWACFSLFRDEWPKPDLPFWARKAYVFAQKTG